MLHKGFALLVWCGAVSSVAAQPSQLPELRVDIEFLAVKTENPYYFYLVYKSAPTPDVLRYHYIDKDIKESIPLTKPGLYEVAVGWPTYSGTTLKGHYYLWKELFVIDKVKTIDLKGMLFSDRYHKEFDVTTPYFLLEVKDELTQFRKKLEKQNEFKPFQQKMTNEESERRYKLIKEQLDKESDPIKVGILAIGALKASVYVIDFKAQRDSLLLNFGFETIVDRVDPTSLVWSFYTQEFRTLISTLCNRGNASAALKENATVYFRQLISMHPDPIVVKEAALAIIMVSSSCFSDELLNQALLTLETRFGDTFAYREAQRIMQLIKDTRRK